MYTDSNGEEIDDSEAMKNENYRLWKDAFLKTDEGQRLWNKYDKEMKNFKLVIKIGPAGSEKNDESGQVDDYTFNEKDELIGATMTLGSNLGQGTPSENAGYAILSTITKDVGADDLTRAIGKFAHEFGHLEDATARGKEFKKEHDLLTEKDQLIKGRSPSDYYKDKRFKEILNTLGDYSRQREYRAENTAIAVLQQHSQKTGKGLPNVTQKAIKRYLNPTR